MTMAGNIFRVDVVDRLCQCISELKNLYCVGYTNEIQQLEIILKKQVWSDIDKDAILQSASKLLLAENCWNSFSQYLSNILPELYLRAREYVENNDGISLNTDNVSALLKLSLNLCCGNSLLHKQICLTLHWISQHLTTLDEEAVIAPFLQLLIVMSDKTNLQIETICNIKHIKLLTESSVTSVRWHAVKLLAKALNVVDTESFLKKFFSNNVFNQLILEDNYMNNLNLKNNFMNNSNIANESDKTHERYFEQNDFHGTFLPIFNMLLEYREGNEIDTSKHLTKLVLTGSTISNMKSLSLAVVSGTPVLLSGGIGCGKTMLVEYLASCLGRNTAPNILKLQLGDQTDSKSLLGTYICAERPGEFKWQPGTLTQAVHQGSWLLLEDIDTAPSDVISTLIPIIKSKCLVIPGHGEEIKVASGFQIFATTRTDCSGFSRNHHSSLHLFSKLCHHISMEVPTKEELIQIVEKRFPNLSNIAFKTVDIYCMVSADTSLCSNDDVILTKLPIGSRSSSPRDLFKWCSRISDLYHLSDGNITNEEIFLNAMQCFCSSIPTISDRSVVAYSLGAKLCLSKEKVEYFLSKYKPNMMRNSDIFEIGSTKLIKKISHKVSVASGQQKFAFTRHSLRLLEDIAVSVKNNEPVLLVGETGGGKTSCVQLLAEQCGQKVNVINMSQQSDIADLLGGFKPIDIRQVVRPIKEKFEEMFINTYSQKQNAKFLGHINQCFSQKKWPIFIKLLTHCCQKAIQKAKKDDEDDSTYEERRSKWKCFFMEVAAVEKKISTQDGLIFSFIEGSLVKSIQTGDWILLDEINLATAETLEYLSGLLDGQSGSMVLTERGDIKPVKRHESFRLFACMNPATDVGKKDLPYGIRNRFTEIYVDEISDSADLKTLVAYYLKNMHIPPHVIDGIVNFYLFMKGTGKEKLVDTSGSRPHYSLRTLCRGLEYAVNQPNISPLRALYEGLCMSFLTQLDRPSHPFVERAICNHIFNNVNNIKSILSQTLPKPRKKNTVFVEGYWLHTGTEEPTQNEMYVLTKSVKGNLKDLSRVVAGGKYPVLLQGETSVGKTSLISYLSLLTGNHCVRINNHEHTDIQEYIGCYGVDDNGSLVFKEGVLVTAMRQGHWIILDELNLAPTDVLEALNRLLDDNRELFIAETQETVKAHPGFMLFATQNPPGHYGGRKMLSRAFRNRFVELHFGEIPSGELEEILHKRCHLPNSYCKKFVKVMLDLQVRRRNSGIFAGKHSFMTLRDLFRWAERYRLSEANSTFNDWEQCICEDGFMLIAGRCRREDESLLIKDTLERNFKKKIDLEKLFGGSALSTSMLSEKILSCTLEEFKHIVWTRNMKRLAVLVGRALQFGEAALLVGDTGCGKTTVCQLFSILHERKLYSVNCHMHTEAADFIGGLRPVRTKEAGSEQKLFEWCDGPLVEAMRDGNMFLIDEISLADDSVLERLNSVLEMERMLVLTERGEVSDEEGKIDVIKAADKFRLLATMNPGGDFGKKELSPALRNRFTEIWCSPSDSEDDLMKIIEHNIKSGVYLKALSKEDSGIGLAMTAFIKWFRNTQLGQRFVISIRDILSWVHFINCCCIGDTDITIDEMDESFDKSKKYISPEEAYVHGCCLVFIDSIGSGNTALLPGTCENVKAECLCFLKNQVGLTSDVNNISGVENNSNIFGIHPFHIRHGFLPCKEDKKYSLNAETTRRNALRLLRGMQLPRPILLEGSPGVGKTSLVIAIARIAGYEITRINLSEETDVSDLFGADLPIEGGQPGQFAWRDGPLLKALKAGHWVVFDEMNLASQSVLEGLNACFDHRAEVFVPELNKSFVVQKDKTKIFACQNPLKEGGGRKGLPKSFLNRFTKVYVDAMSKDDLCLILQSAFNKIDGEVVENMVQFNGALQKEIVLQNKWGRKGGPWEFNVRDLMRWCELITQYQQYKPGDFINLIYASRMRELEDKERVINTYRKIFCDEDITQRRLTRLCQFNITSDYIKIGYSQLSRELCGIRTQTDKNYQLLRYQLPYLENIMKCVQMNWMSILVGCESSGKNAMVGVLAKLSGQPLHTLSMNSGMDTTDFIGGFEQLNLSGHIRDLCKVARSSITELLARAGGELNHLDKLLGYENSLGNILNDEESLKEGGEVKNILEKVEKIIGQLKPYFEFENGISAFENMEKRLEEVKNKWESSRDGKGQFEWVDGVLVKCLKNGYWLLIENVNFCSSSILDRLNGLLEPNGVLTIDECGVVNGEIPKVKPHPNFRMFMSMDPRFGEISRAMRNRGVEIFISSESDGVNLDEIDTELLVRSTLTHPSSMGKYLQVIYDDVCRINEKVKRSSLMKTAALCHMLIYNGEDESTAIKKACMEVYCRNEKHDDMKELMRESIVNNLYKNVNNEDIPLLPCISDFNQSTSVAVLKRICLPLCLSKYDECTTLYKFLLSFERMTFKDMRIGFDYIKSIQVNGLSVYMDRSQSYHNTQTLTFDDETSICESMNNSKDQLSRNAKRYFFMLLQCLKGYNDVVDTSEKNKSIMEISKCFYEGNVSAIGLPHQSVMYLYRLCKNVIDFTQNMWDNVEEIKLLANFAELEDAYSWFNCFMEFCRQDFTTAAFSSNSFSVNKFSLHWKWVYDKFFNWFGESLPDEVKVIVKQVDKLLGHDSLSFILHHVSTTIGIPKTFLFEQQAHLLEMLSNTYNGSLFSEGNDLVNPCCVRLIQCAKDILLSSSFSEKMEEEVHHLKKELSNNSPVMSTNPSLVSLTYASLFALRCHHVVSALHTNEDVDWESIQVLNNYGFKQKIARMSSSVYLSLLKDHCEKKDSVSIGNILPFLNLNLYESTFPDVSSLFSGDTEDIQVNQQFISPCAPLLSMVDTLNKSDTIECQLQISLKDVTHSLSTLRRLQRMLWSNMTIIMSARSEFMNQLNLLSCVDILRVMEGVCLVYKKDTLLHQARNTLSKLSINSCNLQQIMDTMQPFLKSIASDVEVPKSVRSILSCLHVIFIGEENTKNTECKVSNEEILIGNIACLSGLLLFTVTKPTLKYDPVEELQLRLKYLQKELTCVERELKMRYHCEYIWSGVPQIDLNKTEAVYQHLTSNPERIRVLLHRRKLLLEGIQCIEERYAARPSLSQYNALYQDFQHFASSIGKTDHIIAQMKEVNQLLHKSDHNPFTLKHLINVFKKIKTWINSVHSFITKLESSFPLYTDITLFPLLALKRCLSGFNILLTQAKQKTFIMNFALDNKTLVSSNVYPSDVFQHLCHAPSLLPNDVLKTLLDERFLNVCKCISTMDPSSYGNLVPSILNLALLNLRNHLKNNLIIHKGNHDNTFIFLKDILHQYYMLWQHKKQEELEANLNKEAFYRFKSQVHCNELSDEEKLVERQKRLFPSFDHEFSDLVQSDRLEDGCDNEEVSVDADVNMNSVEIDETLLYQIVRDVYLKTDDCFETEQSILKKYLSQLLLLLKLPQVRSGICYEKTTHTVFLTISSMIHDLTTCSTVDKAKFDTYTNSDISEAIYVKNMLEEFQNYIQKLLCEFEEHPALLQIVKVIQRILSFSISSPIMKFLTGLEFLLKEAQNWETYAGSHVSLRKYLEDITSQVIKWRKLELMCWPQLLERCEEKIFSSSCKWFFHLYNLLADVHKAKAEWKDGEDEFIGALKEFFEHATVGDFKGRIEMIKVFLENMKVNCFDEDLQNVVWNVYMYYKQFLPIVMQHISDQKKPIEKELKDYVKIAKWNDINFYAMKQAVGKSHRTLNKFVGKYENILLQPIDQFLKDSKSVSNIPSTEHAKDFHYITHDKCIMDELYDLNIDGDLYVNKVEKLQLKMKTFIDDIVKKTAYGCLVENLDGFTGDIISGIKELQDVDILKLPKEKQKAARNNLQQRKRKALASLFKELKSIGISYRKGINIIDNENINNNNLPKLDECHLMSTISDGFSEGMITSCNDYFFKCQAKQSIFFNSLCSPSKEMGPREISRFKGLTEHLLKVTIDQRRNLSVLLECHKKIGTFIHFAKNIKKHSKEEQTVLPPQKIVKKCLYDLELIVNKSLHTLNQLKQMLDSSPSEDSLDESSCTPFPINSLPKIANCHANSQLLQDVKVVIVKKLDDINSLKKTFCNLDINEMEFPLVNWNHWRFIENSVSSLKGFVATLDDIVPLFTSPINAKNPSMADDVIQLKEEILSFSIKFMTMNTNISVRGKASSINVPEDTLVKNTETIIQQMLISVQGLVKSANDFADLLQEDEDENLLMKSGHLVPLLTSRFYSHINLLDAETLNKSIYDVLSQLENFDHNIDFICLQAFFNVLPLMETVFDLIQYYVFNLLTLHRTSCKLLFVLYGLFTDLAIQGYCIPPEEDGEVSGEGATEFEDIQSGGLGEGEGAKDVSDQIETEDQVEDTKHEKSEEKEEEEGDDIKEEKEGIEMSDDFDGKLQDLELDDENSSDEEEKDGEEEEEEEPDKQMGEVDGDQQETVDDKMWGDSDEEDNGDDEKKEEKGPGAEAKSESQLVAKDDHEGEQEGNQKEEKQKETSEQNEENEIDTEMDDTEVNNMDDEEKEENVNDKNETPQQQDDDGLPDDLDLDKKEENETEEDADEDATNIDEEVLDEETNMEEESEEKGNQDEVDDNEEENASELQEEKVDDDDEKDNESYDKDLKDRNMPSEAQDVEDSVECAPTDSQSTTFESTTNQPQQNESNDQGAGKTESESKDGHLGASDAISKSKPTDQKSRKRKDIQHSKDGRTLETSEMEQAKRRKAVDAEETEKEDEARNADDADMYQHMEDDSKGYDQLAIDAATQDQLSQLDKPQNIPQGDSDVEMEDNDESDANSKVKEFKENDPKNGPQVDLQGLYNEDLSEDIRDDQVTKDEEMDNLADPEERDIKSDFFTSAQLLELPFSSVQERELVMDNLRRQLESELVSLSLNTKEVKSEKEALELWLNYERLTSGLAQQLCEQLRLVLEPTLASKMRGDYRTGKRLNMRKVVPYIASQFRKDKIWLRRTKRSKRQYQIVLAVDDSSSMADNHSKQLAFESLAVISNALQWLEAGDLAVCSFGEEARLIHSFDESFSEQAGASILQQFTFEQKNTKIAQLVNMCSVLLNESKSRQRSASNVSISQLLLIVSDGRGIFLEGKETVEKAVRNARDAGVFIVFLIMDDPKNRDSILDIKVPIFKPGGGMPEIKSYIEEFPFPFYVLLRDINSLPVVLSDSLKQWFELVTQAT